MAIHFVLVQLGEEFKGRGQCCRSRLVEVLDVLLGPPGIVHRQGLVSQGANRNRSRVIPLSWVEPRR